MWAVVGVLCEACEPEYEFAGSLESRQRSAGRGQMVPASSEPEHAQQYQGLKLAGWERSRPKIYNLWAFGSWMSRVEKSSTSAHRVQMIFVELIGYVEAGS
jgi:hypothetical protein